MTAKSGPVYTIRPSSSQIPLGSGEAGALGQPHRRAARRGHLVERAAGEVADPLPVGREERRVAAVGAREQPGLDVAAVAHHETGDVLAGAGDEGHARAVARDRERGAVEAGEVDPQVGDVERHPGDRRASAGGPCLRPSSSAAAVAMAATAPTQIERGRPSRGGGRTGAGRGSRRWGWASGPGAPRRTPPRCRTGRPAASGARSAPRLPPRRGTLRRWAVRPAGSAVITLATMACAVGPVNGGSPTSIS